MNERLRLQRVPPGPKAVQLQGLVRRRDVAETAVEIVRELERQRLDARLVALGFAAPKRRSWPREPVPATIGVLRHSFGQVARLR